MTTLSTGCSRADLPAMSGGLARARRATTGTAAIRRLSRGQAGIEPEPGATKGRDLSGTQIDVARHRIEGAAAIELGQQRLVDPADRRAHCRCGLIDIGKAPDGWDEPSARLVEHETGIRGGHTLARCCPQHGAHALAGGPSQDLDPRLPIRTEVTQRLGHLDPCIDITTGAVDPDKERSLTIIRGNYRLPNEIDEIVSAEISNLTYVNDTSIELDTSVKVTQEKFLKKLEINGSANEN